MPSPNSNWSAANRGLMEMHEREMAEREAKPWLDDRGSGSTYLYFIQPIDGGHIKIGTAKKPFVRLAQLQTGHPEHLVVCNWVWIAQSFERRIHALFGEYRLKGEWFRAHPVIAHIGDCIPDPTLENEAFQYPRDVAALRVPDLMIDHFPRAIGPRAA